MPDVLRIATYNIHACVGGDRRYDPERMLEVLREIDADVLGLQEVGGRFVGDQEQMHFLSERLGMAAVAGPNLVRRKADFGNALLVKGNILHTDLINLTVSRFESRGAIDANVEVHGIGMRVMVTHLGLLRRERRAQIAFLAERLEGRHHPFTVVLGDFNIFGAERTVLMRIGAPPLLPRLRTFPARRPLMALDRVWTIPYDRVIMTRVHRTALSRIASDHLPVVVEVAADMAAHDPPVSAPHGPPVSAPHGRIRVLETAAPAPER